MPLSRRLLRRIFISTGIACLTVFSAALLCDRWVASSTTSHIHRDINTLPAHDIALVLGANPLTQGRPNLFFTSRIDTAATLYSSGKVRHFIVSGDNHTVEYDEPTAMHDALISRGIPASSITLDYAGFRTLDSVLRARDVFGQSRFIIISQEFHCARALFIAHANNIDAIAYPAPDIRGKAGLTVRARETLARTLAVLDTHILNTAPHFPGPPEPIQLAATDH
ncbi:MAG: YdcF family protein [Planctomycetes bacterium]|nr:YdcF family protein [Planctomycetota bacterium]